MTTLTKARADELANWLDQTAQDTDDDTLAAQARELAADLRSDPAPEEADEDAIGALAAMARELDPEGHTIPAWLAE